MEGKQKPTILIVEDDVDIRLVLVDVLTSEGLYDIIDVRTAEEALIVVNETIVDALLLDYTLPSMNGLELYDYIHKKVFSKYIPTLFISANVSLPDLQERSLQLLQKPFDIDDLLQYVQHLVER
jgi:CheY-like chemotaxis protein